MNEIQIFEHEAFGQIRVIDQDGEPWFVAEDVCRALNIANTTDALTRLDEDEKARFNLGGLPGRDTNCVNEPGLYSLVLGSRKPEAKAFKRWITHEVLPVIRQTGSYSLVTVDTNTSQRALTSDDYLRAAVIVARCKNDCLPYVLGFPEKGGWEIPKIQDTQPEHQPISVLVNRTFAESGLTMIQLAKLTGLKLTNTAGVKMKLYSPTEKGTPREWKDIGDDGIIVTRLQNLEDDGYKGKVKVGANAEGGTEWTIDYTGVEMRELGTELQVDALNGTITIGDDSSKKGSDLQSDVTITRKRVEGVVTFAIRGNSSYIPFWGSFSSKDEEKKGNYVALKLTAPEGYANTGIKVSDGTRTVTCDASGEVVVILDGRNSNKRTVTVEAEGKNKLAYVLDFSGMKLLPAEILGVTVNSRFADTLEGLAAAYKDGKIHLSGKVEPKESNESLFNDAQLKVNIGAEGREKLVTLRFIKSGDTLEVISDPTSIAGNTLEFDTSMLVIKKADATDVATTAAPSASISDTIPEEQKEAAQEVSTALGNSDTQIDEATLQKYANVISNDSTGKGTLVADAAKIVEEHGDKMPIALKEQIEDAAKASANGETNLDVTTVVQTYAKIDVVGVVTSEDGTTSFEISITPMARTIVTTLGNEDVEGGRMKIFDPDATETNANSKANAIIVNDEGIKIGEPTPVTLVLPDSYKAATAFIKHVKDNGDKYVYEGKITGIAPRKLEFISEHGFSSFTVSAEKPVLDQSSDATLSEVKAGEYTVTKSGNDYTVNVPEGADVTKLPLTLTATDSKVQGITVNGTAYTAGMEIDLTTAAKIVVTAEDGTTAEYTLTAVVGADPQPWTNPYTDVKDGDWFYDAVKYVNQNGLMEGTSANKFSPRSDLTRGMFAQILYNAAGKPSVTWTNKFSDVKEGDWYASAIIWAADQGVLAGYGNGTARPKRSITREDLVSLLWRYEGSPAPTSTTLNFSDASKVSSYAKDAMLWAVENDIVTGTSGKLNPQGNAMRAECKFSSDLQNPGRAYFSICKNTRKPGNPPKY